MTGPVGTKEQQRIRSVAQLLHTTASRIRILRAIDWPLQVKEEFFAQGARELPRVEYRAFDPEPTIDAIREARRLIMPMSPIDLWLDRQASGVEIGARMLAAVGTPVFFEQSRRAYGEPTEPLRYIPATPLELAQRVHAVIDGLARIDLGATPPAQHSAQEVAAIIDREVKVHFADDAPEVQVVDALSSNALATSKQIRIRRDARFTDRDAAQLLHHEAYVRVATSLNGRAQSELPVLADGHPGTTRTQEGLAVFAELMSGSMELDRFRRLADRVFAIQMAIEGADFLDVYRYYLERTGNEDQAFESARRVFRGGVITGGAPFTKDVVYLFGLLQVSTAVRAMFAAGRSDCLRIMFCGKLDMQDVPVLCQLSAMGLCKPPRYLPPWVSDLRSVLAQLTFSTFLQGVDIEPLVGVVQRVLEDAPVVTMPD